MCQTVQIIEKKKTKSKVKRRNSHTRKSNGNSATAFISTPDYFTR